ncbi:MAG TPA: GAF domain-containing sensor histidine kinase [Sandaracinaceae bacterium LLY-WYZ-13_1]|nr:GAF domain-containing sensor histidine kinase [Sandaracinaceae bacterium LLY-WYZ-13_1]
MVAAPPHPQERERLHALYRYEILDTVPERSFDEIAELAASICDTPISLVTLIDRSRQWFKSRVGIDISESDRDCSFCAHAVYEDRPLLVTDASEDPRFIDNRMVLRAPHIRFYYGVPVHARSGLPLGTLCVIDRESRRLDASRMEALETLAHQVEAQIELRRTRIERQRLGRFVVHDLKNPLASMTLDAEDALCELRRGERPEEQLQELCAATRTLHHMVLDLHEIFTEEAGGLTPDCEPVELDALVDAVARQTRLRRRERAIELETRLRSEARAIRTDPYLVRRVLENLVYNALEVAPEGSSIVVSTIDAADRVELRVIDEGPGVPPEERTRVFELGPFRGPRKRGSRGIGLAFCRVAAEALGGHIEIEPSERGASFLFSLPRADDDGSSERS